MREIQMILQWMWMRKFSLKDAGISLEVEENGQTFAENARI